jgi:tetratricopeptide (TPR) repeat protein
MTRPLALLVPIAVLFAACATTDLTAYHDGVRLYREGWYGAARDAFDTAVRQDPQNAAAINNRGVTKARLGDLDGAVIDYTQALELTPGDAEIVFNRANAYAAGGNLPAAIKDFTTAVTLRPDYAQAYFNRGTVRSALGDTTGALADWQFAVAVERDPWAKAAMARAAGLDYVSASPSALPRAVTSPLEATPPATPPAPPSPSVLLTPRDAGALVARAMAREVEGDRSGAITDLRAAVIAEPDPARRNRIDRLLRTLEAPQ